MRDMPTVIRSVVNNSIRSIYREVFPSRKKPVDEVAELRSEIKKLGGGGATGTLLSSLKKLADIKGADVTALFLTYEALADYVSQLLNKVMPTTVVAQQGAMQQGVLHQAANVANNYYSKAFGG